MKLNTIYRHPKRTRLLIALTAALFAGSTFVYQMYSAKRVHAAGFTAGNIVVYRVGDGSGSLTAVAAPIFIDEYTPAGAFVQTIAMPTTVSGSNKRLTASGSATTEGLMARSANGQYLVVSGYDAAPGAVAIATPAATVNRVVGIVDSNGTVDTTTALSDAFNSGNIRSAVSSDGNRIWMSGSNEGVRTTTRGSTTSSLVSTTQTNLRAINVFSSQLYVSSGAGTNTTRGVNKVGAGLPTSSGNATTRLAGFSDTSNPSTYGYVILDNPNNAISGIDTIYVADDTSSGTEGGLQKWTSIDGINWTKQYRALAGASAFRGVAGQYNGATLSLFAVTTDSRLVAVTDTGAGFTFTTLVTAASNTALRGVALAPSSGPPNQAIVPNCPSSINTQQGAPASAGVSATDPDGTVTSAAITSTPVAGITLDGFTQAPSVGGTANATLNVANTTAAGTYNVTIRYSNNDATPQTADCTVVVTVTPPNQPIAPSCPASINTPQGTATSAGVSATDPDGTVTSASIISAPIAGITLNSFTPAAGSGGTATATLNVSNTTAIGTYNVTIRYSNNDATPQTADCTVVVNVNVPPDSVVISQVYGGGGNTGSTYKNDFIELINHSSVPVNLDGWSVQAFVNNDEANVHEWQMTPLTNVTLQPGQYYLVQESQGAGGTDNLPTPDAIGTIPVSSSSTKVALVTNTTLITAACPNANAVVDLVGYGTSAVVGTCHEGSGAAPQLSNTIAIQRRNEGCFDSDDNAADFITTAPSPHNTSSAVHDCTGLSAFGSANPSTVVQGESSTLTVRVDPAQNPASTGVTVTADLTSIGGSASQAFAGSGDVFTYTALVPANNPPGMKSLLVTVSDGQGRTANTNILLSILPIIADHVTISQIYGGGGNSGATYSNDYVELYNPTAATVTMTGWSLQYGSATGTTFTGKTVIGGTIAPGAHYLVSLASQNSNVGAPLPPPPPSVSGDINMAAGNGKIALVRNSDTLAGPCPVGSDPDIVDFVGYGATANCHEGNANAPGAGNNTTAIFRKNNGETDTDQNGNDFITGPPNPRSESPVAEFGPSVGGTEPATNATIAPYDSTITVFFSEPVTVDSGWYDITCTVTGSHTGNVTEAHSSDQKTYAVTPNVSFQFGEQCTVTITKTAVHDVDTDDGEPGTDTMTDDYVWSFTVVGAGQPAPYPPSVHLTMGNPSGADLSQPLNYLMEKPTYSLSYNRDKGTPNWVSWHLENTWYGTLARVDTFRPDPNVDPTWYRVQTFDYTNSGFDRGHMTPNADRDNQNRIPINQETYLMTNMIPQAPDNNQGPWADLEAYLRTQTDAGNEIYVVSGPAGVGGTGSAGFATTIANGHVTVPEKTWKVALVLPQGTNDTSRVSCSTRTIAVILPNVQGIRNEDWQNYLTTVDTVETLTNYNLFSNLPPAVQACIEAGTNGTNPPGTADQSANTAEDNSVTVTLEALRSNNNTLTFSIVNGPTSGSLGSVSSASCSSGTCTATVTYTPGADFNGADSFTFRASDGALNSNTSTVNITVSPVNDNPNAVDDAPTIAEDSGGNLVNVLSNDTDVDADTLSVSSVTPGANGSVTNNGSSVTYTPNANFFGSDSFTYSISDGHGGNDTATVNVTVTNVQDAPDAVDDAATVIEDSSANAIDVRANDSDVDGDTLTVSSVTQGAHGSVAITGGGTGVSYTPAANYFGSDSFTYTIGDGQGGSDTATVNITVTNVNDNPVLTSSVAVTQISATNSNLFNVGLAASATDADGEVVTITVAVFGDENDETATVPGVVHSPDAKDIAPGTLRLRGERVEANDGRVYLIVVTATDPSGGVSRNYHTVVVPKNNKQANINSVNAQAAAAVSYAQTHGGAPPVGYFIIGDGPVIGPKQ